MKQVGIPKNETQMITNLYFRQVARVQCNAGLTPEFEIRKGVRQGCILSPNLFNLYSEMLIKEAMDEEDGIKINGKTISMIRYADDTAVVAPTRHSTTNDGQNQFGMRKLQNEIKCEGNKGDNLEEGQ